VQEELHRLGLDVTVVEMPDSTRTAEEAAAAVGTTVGRIVKSLVFLAGGEPVLALVSGPNRLDTKRLAELAGGTVERAPAERVREVTGYAVGGIPPVGHATTLRTFCDRDLLAFDTVWAAAGTPRCVFEVEPGALVRVTGAEVANLKT
jgi:Cys-tRNA(Pro) deacylase